MTSAPEDRAEHRLVSLDVLASPDPRMDVPVLERAPVTGIDTNPLVGDPRDRPGDDRVDLRAIRRRDVDPEVEREPSAPVQDAAHRRRGRENRSRVAEAAADRVRAIEWLDRPAIAPLL